MAGLLAAEGEIARVRRIEEHHRLGSQGAALGGAEGQHVGAALPARLGRRTAQRRHGIGEAGPVQMQFQALVARQHRDGSQFVPAIDRAQFGRLRQADGERLNDMHIAAMEVRQRRGDALQASSLPCGPGMPISLAPWLKNSGAPHSCTMMWLCSWHSIAPCAGTRVASASELAAVPVSTGNIATSRSNRLVETRAQRVRCVIASRRHRARLCLRRPRPMPPAPAAARHRRYRMRSS